MLVAQMKADKYFSVKNRVIPSPTVFIYSQNEGVKLGVLTQGEPLKYVKIHFFIFFFLHLFMFLLCHQWIMIYFASKLLF